MEAQRFIIGDYPPLTRADYCLNRVYLSPPDSFLLINGSLSELCQTGISLKAHLPAPLEL
jgi:hypothetical protein